jgi:heme A synthase
MAISVSRDSSLIRYLVFVFAGTVAMASAGYVLLLPALQMPSAVVATIILAVMALTCIRSAGASHRPVIAGVITGLLLSLLTLLLIGSILSDLEQSESNPNLVVMSLGWLTLGVVLGGICGVLSKMLPSRADIERLWVTRLALVATLAALILLVLGGVVTTQQAGLAVPDWPNTFGTNMFLFPLSKMTGGIYYEHSHRLFGALVGIITLTLTAACLFTRQSISVKMLGLLVTLWVIGQGILGGLRVTGEPTLSQTDTSPIDALGIVHGVTGQMFVAMLGALIALTHPRWQLPKMPVPKAVLTRRVSMLALGALLIQIIFGAMLRHSDLSRHALFSHLGWSIVVIVLIMLIAMRMLDAAKHGPGKLYRKLGMATLHTMILQVALGGVALWAVMTSQNDVDTSTMDLLFSTAHQALGAMLLIYVTQCALWSYALVNAPKSQRES